MKLLVELLFTTSKIWLQDRLKIKIGTVMAFHVIYEKELKW